MLDDTSQDAVARVPGKAAAADRDRRLARRRARSRVRCSSCSTTSRRLSTVGDLDRGATMRAQAVVRAAPTARRRASASPAFRWAMNSRRWCSRCCRWAAIRRRSSRGRSNRSASSKATAIRNVRLADLPELPGSRAGAECDGGGQSAHASHHDRRRAVPERSRARGVMAVPSVFMNGELFGQGRSGWRKSSRSSTPMLRAARPRARRPRTLRHADRRRRTCRRGGRDLRGAQGHPTGIVAERFGGQVLDTLGIENFISVKETEGPKLPPGSNSTSAPTKSTSWTCSAPKRSFPAS